MSRSPPSRAAWIEIEHIIKKLESLMSPPSRAAWIEITLAVTLLAASNVAAFTGGVD